MADAWLVPPPKSPPSTSKTRRPALLSRLNAHAPCTPPPTIATSKSHSAPAKRLSRPASGNLAPPKAGFRLPEHHRRQSQQREKADHVGDRRREDGGRLGGVEAKGIHQEWDAGA